MRPPWCGATPRQALHYHSATWARRSGAVRRRSRLEHDASVVSRSSWALPIRSLSGVAWLVVFAATSFGKPLVHGLDKGVTDSRKTGGTEGEARRAKRRKRFARQLEEEWIAELRVQDGERRWLEPKLLRKSLNGDVSRLSKAHVLDGRHLLVSDDRLHELRSA